MKRLVAISLAIIILMSNLGLTVATHYCGGHAVESGLLMGGGDFDCGMEGGDTEHRVVDENCAHFTAESCCENLHQTIQTDNTLQIDLPAPEFHAPTVAEFVVYSFLFFEPVTAGEIAPFRIFPPPLPGRDVQILFQTFLI